MKVVIREGMACENVEGPVTLTFRRRILQPHMWNVECDGCGETWKTDAQPGSYPTLAEVAQ